MLSTNIIKKNKVQLEDYPFQRDIDNRLFLAQLSIQDISILEEILNSSLHIDIVKLADATDSEISDLQRLLKQLERIGLLSIQTSTFIAVNKDMRKYFEAQILRFENNFEPNFDYIKLSLKKIPIDTLHNWYSFTRTPTDIYSSILEKYLYTPRIYQRYLDEMTCDDPIIEQIIHEVFNSADFKVPAKDLKEKFNIENRKFEEYLLQLEFNFILFSCFENRDGHLVEMIVPLYAWKEHLFFLKEAKPKLLPPAQISFLHRGHFGFIQDMTGVLKKFLSTSQAFCFNHLSLSNEHTSIISKEDYCTYLINKMIELQLLEKKEDGYAPGVFASQWLSWSLEEQGVAVYRSQLNQFSAAHLPQDLFNERNLRAIEKSLNDLETIGWITIDSFIKSMIHPLNRHEEVTMRKSSRVWRFVRPIFSVEEKKFIELAITQRFMESGVAVIGTYRGQIAFNLTPFGKNLLLD